MESEDGATRFASRDDDDLAHLRSRHATVAYTPLMWVIEDHAASDDLDDAEPP